MKSSNFRRSTSIVIAILLGIAVASVFHKTKQELAEPKNQSAQNQLETVEKESGSEDGLAVTSEGSIDASAVQQAAPTDEAPTTQAADAAASSSTTATAGNSTPSTTKVAEEANGMVGGATVTTSGDVFSYTAQTGDSYTVLARKAIQTYGLTEKVNLSEAQIVAAETALTQNGHDKLLEIGQKVDIAKNDVATAVKNAQSLSTSQLADWQVYVPSVNFDTSKAGQ